MWIKSRDCIRKGIIFLVLASLSFTSCAENKENTDVGQSIEAAVMSELAYAVQNDLEVDGAPISIPCTKNEFLKALGKKYSFDEYNDLYYDKKRTMLYVTTDYYDEDKIRCVGFRYDDHSRRTGSYITSEIEKGVLTLRSVKGDIPYSMEDVLEAYTMPNIDISGSETKLQRLLFYDGEDHEKSAYTMQCVFSERGCESIIINFYETNENID
ncbi:MAG: hypothetical protein NC092_06390 [Butyrivibrio sp.]|nr:hypothetical protein [Muribaculum sp.]MCM1552304.1 hypothetical protein [Butyrivibrio sp.]